MALPAAKTVDSGREARSFAQPPNRFRRFSVRVQQRFHLRVRISESVQVTHDTFLERTRFLPNGGCQIGRGRWFFRERRGKVSTADVEYLPHCRGRGECPVRVVIVRHRLSHLDRTCQLIESSAYFFPRVRGLLCRERGIGRGLIAVRHWVKPSNEADCYANERNRQSDERRPTWWPAERGRRGRTPVWAWTGR